ncbi:WD40 repeat domain-containing protein [Pseudoalteromonas luteoviolacea]|uniref:Uncharacterized protein n=1 Tax=Pseudoalteromonas luteoviolacea H33 TaxID=1365251 RepID=A0A167B4F9_9GAMM|nr:hypothetical protein [Pseudoalteromonas luteoviolacea]KZN46150.1 hypothetical protein N476_03240 [Pseudoalteromonas luteoviolacea H33]KZN75195.1 hypothetical protein N477_20155 [Pseudoalteromonas luteoviolacea H33-S]
MFKNIINIFVAYALLVVFVGCDKVDKNHQSDFYQVSQAPIDHGVFSARGDFLAFVSQDQIIVADAQGGGTMAQFALSDIQVTDIALSVDNRLLAASFMTYVVVWDLVKQEKLGQFKVVGESEYAKTSKVAIYDNPMILLIGMTDGSVNVIDFKNKLTKRVKHHDAKISFLTLGPQRQLLLSAGHDGLVNISDARTLQPKFEHKLSKRVTSLAYNLEQNLLFISDSMNEQWVFKPFSTQDYSIKLAYRERFRWFRASAISPDGQYLATGSSKFWWTLWHVKTGQEIDAFAIQAVTSTAMILDMHIDRANKLVTLSSDGIVEYWEINTLINSTD